MELFVIVVHPSFLNHVWSHQRPDPQIHFICLFGEYILSLVAVILKLYVMGKGDEFNRCFLDVFVCRTLWNISIQGFRSLLLWETLTSKLSKVSQQVWC